MKLVVRRVVFEVDAERLGDRVDCTAETAAGLNQR
jgi:hypothetical protein